MSVLQNPIVGRMKQKIGGVVMTTWKGINVMKGKPLTVANPNTDAQQMRRSALRQIVEIARTISGVLNQGFKEQAVRKSAFNAFCGYNLRNAFSYAGPPNAVLQPAQLLTAQGTIAVSSINSIALSAAGNSATVTFPTSANLPGQSASDIARVAVFNETSGGWAQSVTTAPRSAGTITAILPTGYVSAGETYRVYIFFYNTTDRKSSDSLNSDAVAGA